MSKKEEKRFWDLPLSDRNWVDAKNWLDKEVLIGLVDEKTGGIIGYIHQDHISKVINKLNKVIK